MKKVLFMGMAAALLTACSNDEVVPVNNEGNAIRFGVTTENNSRAADIFCSSHKFNEFTVFATFGDQTYIDGDIISFSNDEWTNTSGLRYWPDGGDVTFYGSVNGTLNTTNVAAPKFVDFEPASTVGTQVDLLYARKTQAKSATNVQPKVELNFRHALSQIVFNARNDNANLYVEIKGVSVVNVSGKGTYTLPSEDTSTKISHPNGDGTVDATTQGTWSGLANATSSYSVEFETAKPVTGNKNLVDLTTYSHGDNILATDFNQAMLLIPQTTTKVNVENAIAGQTGSYFLVKCKIWNVAGNSFNPNTDIQLWGGENYAEVLLPVDFAWSEGKKYTYTFVFGNGNGGYNPEPDPEDPTPDPVLVPIEFTVDVDEFTPVSGGTIETGVPTPNA